MGGKVENTENSLKDANEVGDTEREGMVKKTKGGKTYYTTRKEAEAVRRKGDRIYYSEEEKAYYIKRVRRPFWGW